MDEKKYKVTEKGIAFIYLYEIKRITKWCLVISISNLIIILIQMLIKTI